MKKLTKTFAILLVLVLTTVLCAVPAFAYTASYDLLSKKADEVASPWSISYANFYNIDSTKGEDMLNVGNNTYEYGGKVMFSFSTLKGRNAVGRIIVNPLLIKNKELTYNWMLDLESENIANVKQKFEKFWEKDVAVIGTAYPDTGMVVVISARVDISGMNKDNLVAYSYNAENNTYALINKANCTVDDMGFVSLQTTKGGYIIITEAAK